MIHSMPAHGDATSLLRQAACDFVYRDFSQVEDSIAFWSTNLSDYLGVYADVDHSQNHGFATVTGGVRLGGSVHLGAPYFFVRRSLPNHRLCRPFKRLCLTVCSTSLRVTIVFIVWYRPT